MEGDNPSTKPKEQESGAAANVLDKISKKYQTPQQKECSAFSTAMQKIGLQVGVDTGESLSKYIMPS